MNAPWFRWSDDVAGDDAEEAVTGQSPEYPAFLDDECEVLDAEGWDEWGLAAFLAQPPWASEVGDDLLNPYG